MRLLVVEDDVALGQILVRGLTEDGYAVDLVTGVADARHNAESHRYDSMVIDIGLPDGNGLDLCHELRDRGDQTPILMLTARDGLSDKVGGLDAGADDYLTKPFDFPELTARVRALTRRPPDVHKPLLEAGDLSLDPASRRVWRGAITVPLTAREFSLLEHLLRRPDAIHSRTELLESVWDANYDGLSNVVDVHIANLRRKLEMPGSVPAIDTVRGAGYRLNPELFHVESQPEPSA
ncbi:MAG: response regulator transcription factor [Actinomycetota bacterium]